MCIRDSLDAKVYQLSIGQMQRVEIVKALYRGAKILILDEPTAVLTPQEVEELIQMMKRLKAQGCSIIIITHKLKEVMAATDKMCIRDSFWGLKHVNTGCWIIRKKPKMRWKAGLGEAVRSFSRSWQIAWRNG